MAKKATKPNNATEKKVFDLEAFKKSKGLNKSISEKELTWIPFSSAFHEALGIPGIPRGYTTLIRGYSNTGKSTGMYEAIVGCQKIGDLPIIIDTEGNFNWEHAKNIGFIFEESVSEDGKPTHTGDFIYVGNRELLEMYELYDYDEAKDKIKPVRNEPVIEDVSRLIDEFLDMQNEGTLPRSLCFLWDSVGSLDCFRAVKSKSKNNMWNAGALETSFKSILNFRIPDSRRETSEYCNTFFCVQKVWFDNLNGVMKHKGGEALFYGSRLIIHLGGLLTHGTIKLNAESEGRKYQFGIQAKVRTEKNQINGIEKSGNIASTPHGYWDPEKINEYKKEKKEFILSKLNTTSDDFIISKEEIVEFSSEDLGN